MGEAIVFTSGKGGVGKTTTIANIGHAYRYIIHHKLKPYIIPSISINTGIT